MQKNDPECPGWSFEIDEISAGVYEIRAKDINGRSFSKTAVEVDIEKTLEDATRYASQLFPPSNQ